MTKTKIEWTRGDDGSEGATWNPIRGCSRVSPGCLHCYAEAIAGRFSDVGKPFAGFAEIGPRRGEARWTGRVELLPDKLDLPLRWRRPRRIFVNSTSDLFHESLPYEDIDMVFAAMAQAHHHTFQVLTKRAERMRDYFRRDAHLAMTRCFRNFKDYDKPVGPWPLPNVWLGVSVEDQRRAEERVPFLLQTPAALRFISAEPLLGPIDLTKIPYVIQGDTVASWQGVPCWVNALSGYHDNGIDRKVSWVIVGGESGPGARPCDITWVRSIVRQCREAGTRVFVKQLGARAMMRADTLEGRRAGDHPEHEWPNGTAFGTAEGHMGTEWQGRWVHAKEDESRRRLIPLHRKLGDPEEWPADLRVRQFPEVERG